MWCHYTVLIVSHQFFRFFFFMLTTWLLVSWCMCDVSLSINTSVLLLPILCSSPLINATRQQLTLIFIYLIFPPQWETGSRGMGENHCLGQWQSLLVPLASASSSPSSSSSSSSGSAALAAASTEAEAGNWSSVHRRRAEQISSTHLQEALHSKGKMGRWLLQMTKCKHQQFKRNLHLWHGAVFMQQKGDI